VAESEINWLAIESEYRAGIRALRPIGEQYGVTEAGIRKRAKRDEWDRDLTARIKAREPVSIPDEFGRAGFLYVIYLDDTSGQRFYKIGMAGAFTPRFQVHQCASPFKINVACAYYVGDMRMEEQFLHSFFKNKHVRGEWFYLDDDDIGLIASRSKLI
jgi:hypothetical protein